jgi:hypothetical protein
VATTQEERLRWVKSSKSGSDGCVEVDLTEPHAVFVRDSKDPDGAILEFNEREWEAFVAGARAGEFDRPAGRAGGRPGYSRAPWSRHVGRRWLSTPPPAAAQAARHRGRRRNETMAVPSRRVPERASPRRARTDSG